MQLSTSDINTRYAQGIDYLTNITYNRFLRNLYGVQVKHTSCDRKLLLLLRAADTWNNRIGATNILTEKQFLSIMDNIAKCRKDELAATNISVDSKGIVTSPGSGGAMTLSVADTQSIDLSYSENVLKANIKISSKAGNAAQIKSDGLFIENISGGHVLFLKQSDFTGNTYSNSAVKGKVQIWHRGLGFLIYNFNNPSDPLNEYSIDNSTGGFTITIPGFDVQDGNNYFHVIY